MRRKFWQLSFWPLSSRQWLWVYSGGSVLLALALLPWLWPQLQPVLPNLWLGAQQAPLLVLALLLLTLLFNALAAVKWRWLAQLCHQENLPLRFVLLHANWHNWLGQWLPMPVAQMLGRGLSHQLQGRFAAGAGLGLFDLALDFAPYVAVSALALALLLGLPALLAATIGLVVLGLLLLVLARLQPTTRQHLLGLGLLSLARFGCNALRFVLLGLLLHESLAALALVGITALTAFSALIPLTPGNLGVAEASWGLAFMLFGSSMGAGVAFALAARLTILVAQSASLLLTWLACQLGRHAAELPSKS